MVFVHYIYFVYIYIYHSILHSTLFIILSSSPQSMWDHKVFIFNRDCAANPAIPRRMTKHARIE